MIKGILVYFEKLVWVYIEALGKSIGLHTKSSWLVVNNKVVFEQGFKLSSLSLAKLLYDGEVLEIVVIRVDLNAMLGSFKIGMPLSKDFYNCKELFIVDVLVKLNEAH